MSRRTSKKANTTMSNHNDTTTDNNDDFIIPDPWGNESNADMTTTDEQTTPIDMLPVFLEALNEGNDEAALTVAAIDDGALLEELNSRNESEEERESRLAAAAWAALDAKRNHVASIIGAEIERKATMEAVAKEWDKLSGVSCTYLPLIILNDEADNGISLLIWSADDKVNTQVVITFEHDNNRYNARIIELVAPKRSGAARQKSVRTVTNVNLNVLITTMVEYYRNMTA